jgi:iron(III) transport system ATP-binding protein
MAADILKLDGVDKAYGTESVILDLSLAVEDGEILTVLGPSGCGKTTTLRLVAGLERPDAGAVRIGGETVAGGGSYVAPEQRDVGVVFQEFALFPHMTAEENVAFGLNDVPAEQRAARVEEMLDLVGLVDQRDAHPDELSGGQQQRVALARSLAPEPEILLLDEPFSNLDVDLRIEMRERVREILKAAGVTAVSVTHDQEEAMSISDRVAVMQAGSIVQVGEPEQVFQHPESRFVAGFLGHASFLSGFVSGETVETDLGPVPREQIHGLAEPYDKTRIDVLVRPDDVQAREVEDEAVADGRVVNRRYLGPTVLYRIQLDNGDRLEVMHNHTDQVALDAPVAVDLSADHDLAWFPREMNPAEETSEVAVGADEATAADGGIGDEGVPRDDGAVDELRQQDGSERADD